MTEAKISTVLTVPPTVKVENQLIGCPLGQSVVLRCLIEAWPKPINYWLKTDGNEREENQEIIVGRSVSKINNYVGCVILLFIFFD